jgi:hypothetical protein
MSETQLKITGTFKAVDEQGKEHHITEYSLFRHTTTTDMAQNMEGDMKEYRVGKDSPVRQIAENEFEIVSDGTRLRRID